MIVEISEELKILDLKELAKNCPYPTLLIFGSKDKLNLSSMKNLYILSKDSQLHIMSDGLHILNKTKPKEFVKKGKKFPWIAEVSLIK